MINTSVLTLCSYVIHSYILHNLYILNMILPRFGAYLLLLQNDLFPLGCESIDHALEVPVKEHSNHSNVVNGTLSGPRGRVIRGNL